MEGHELGKGGNIIYIFSNKNMIDRKSISPKYRVKNKQPIHKLVSLNWLGKRKDAEKIEYQVKNTRTVFTNSVPVRIHRAHTTSSTSPLDYQCQQQGLRWQGSWPHPARQACKRTGCRGWPLRKETSEWAPGGFGSPAGASRSGRL